MSECLFGCVVATRAGVNFAQIDETRFAAEVPDAAALNRFCLWLNAPLPPGYQAAIYTSWAHESAVPELVGFVSNECPSGVFSICRSGFPVGVLGTQEVNAIIGVSVETVEAISALVRPFVCVCSAADLLDLPLDRFNLARSSKRSTTTRCAQLCVGSSWSTRAAFRARQAQSTARPSLCRWQWCPTSLSNSREDWRSIRSGGDATTTASDRSDECD